MALSWDEAMAALTAPGQRFEVGTATVGGIEEKVFVNVPANLRDAFAAAHTRTGDPFLVYEDETWTFGDVGAHVAALGAALV